MEKDIHFYSGPALKLAGILETPPDLKEREKRPGIVLCQGPAGSKDYVTPAVSKWLAREGYVVLRFDYRGFGESEGHKNRLIPFEQVEDIRNAITFMECQEEVDEQRIGLWGAATGGANAIYTAAIDSRAKCAISVSGMGDVGRWLRVIRRYWEWKEFLKTLDEDRTARVMTGKSHSVDVSDIILPGPDATKYRIKSREMYPKSKAYRRELTLESAEALINFQPESVVDRISPRAAMWICAGEDTLLPIDESRSMYEKAGEPKKLVILEDFEHHAIYYEEGMEHVMTHSTEWFDTYLRSG